MTRTERDEYHASRCSKGAWPAIEPHSWIGRHSGGSAQGAMPTSPAASTSSTPANLALMGICDCIIWQEEPEARVQVHAPEIPAKVKATRGGPQRLTIFRMRSVAAARALHRLELGGNLRGRRLGEIEFGHELRVLSSRIPRSRPASGQDCPRVDDVDRHRARGHCALGPIPPEWRQSRERRRDSTPTFNARDAWYSSLSISCSYTASLFAQGPRHRAAPHCVSIRL